MNDFYVTFGSNHPLRNHYIVVRASDLDKARKAVIDVFGMKWSRLYKEEPNYADCPLSVVGEILQGE